MLSSELFVIPVETDRFLVYAPLRRAAFVGNAGFVNLLADLKEGKQASRTDDSMISFLRKMEMWDAGDETFPAVSSGDTSTVTSVTFMLTTSCNLRCSYCYASAGDRAVQSMPLSVAKQGIDFVMDNAVRMNRNSIEVNYHGGGEPAMNWDVMTGSLAYARERADSYGLDVFASTASNGVLSDMQIDWMIENLQGASISFDGLPRVHDQYRTTPSGKGSSEKVMHTLRRFDQAGFPYGIRTTVTAGAIPEMADSVGFICAHFRPQRIQVEPVYLIGRWTHAVSAETEAFIDGYREAQKRAKKYGQEITFSGARLGLLTNHFCSATDGLFAVLPDGKVSACYEVFSDDNPWSRLFFYGNADGTTYRFDTERLDFLQKQAVQYRDYCRGCFAKWSCGGDCLHKALTVTGSPEFAGTGRCHIIRELTKDQILSKIAESGGICWHEKN